jgi:CO/xanthine dehydrogenase FAD-binding subunit
MKPLEFLEPKTVKEAFSLLSTHKEEAKIIAGGQSLMPILKQRLFTPKYLINIKGLSELDYIKELPKELRIGAITTNRSIETSPVISRKFPMVAEMEKVLGSIQIRNWGTIGGSLSHADPCADPAPVFLALEARVKAVGQRGEREILLKDFMVGYLETVLEVDEILTEVVVPYLSPNSAGAYMKESIRIGDTGIANVTTIVTLNGKKKIKEARIVLGCQSTPPITAVQAAKAAVGKGVEDSLDDVAEVIAKEARFSTDILGTVEYKLDVAKVLTKRALRLAITRAQAT